MNRCESFQAQLLDYLYDLLDEPAAQELREHLASCTSCQAARDRAEGQKRLLAAAAKMEFPEVRFGIAALPAAEPWEEPAVLRVPAGGWLRWAVAATVLLLVGGLGLGTNAYWQQHDRVVLAQVRE